MSAASWERRPRVDLEDRSGLPVGEAPGPRGRPSRQVIATELAHRRDGEAGRGVPRGEILKVRAVQRRHTETARLAPVALGNTQHDREARLGLAQHADAGERRHAGTGDGGQQAAPGKHHGDPVGHAGKLEGQDLDARPNVDHVAEPLAGGSAGKPAETGGVGVDADEQPVRRVPAERIG